MANIPMRGVSEASVCENPGVKSEYSKGASSNHPENDVVAFMVVSQIFRERSYHLVSVSKYIGRPLRQTHLAGRRV